MTSLGSDGVIIDAVALVEILVTDGKAIPEFAQAVNKINKRRARLFNGMVNFRVK